MRAGSVSTYIASGSPQPSMPPAEGPLWVCVEVTNTWSGRQPVRAATAARMRVANSRGIPHNSRLTSIARSRPCVTAIARARSGAVIFCAARLRYGP